MEPEERAAAGLFLAFQYPVEMPGVGNANFLRTALNAIRRTRGEPELDAMQFLKLARARMQALSMPEDMLKRGVNVGFSGGEKKRNEMLQMALLEPEDRHPGRDRQRPGHRRAAHRGRRRERAARPRLLRAGHHPLPAAARPHRAGPRARAGQGRIVASGGPELAHRLEAEGYGTAWSRRRHEHATRSYAGQRAAFLHRYDGLA